MIDPVVSVVVATYRRGASLADALKSVANQSFRDFEIILVDDNDNEEWNKMVSETVDDFKIKYSDIRLLYVQNHPNQGSAKTRNRGIGSARGKYITFLDDDDLYLENKLKNQVAAMEEANADYSITDLALYGEDEKLSEIRKRNYLNTEEADDLLLCHLKYHMTGTDTMMFSAEYIRSFGGFEPIDVGDEFYLMMKAIEKKGKFVYVDSCDVKAYVHTGDGGLSSGQGKIDGENRLYEFKKKYFPGMKKKDTNYIKMRHHAVLAFAYKRSGQKGKFIKEGFKAVLSAPVQSVSLLRELKRK